MSGDWQSNWNAEAELRPGKTNTPCFLLSLRVSLPPRRGTHRRSNSTPLEHTSSQLLAATGSGRPEESDYAALEDDKAGILADVLHGPVLTKARSDRLRSRGEPRSARRGPVHASLSHRQAGAGGQRVSGRMTKGKAKLAVLHEAFESSEEEGGDSGEDGYGHMIGKGGKVKRVLANRQSAQRSRIRKLQHISELEETLQGLQDDVHKLSPQLTKMQAKQADLDNENQELRQKLSSLLQESRHKESVNQALITEVSELRLKQDRAHSDHHHQRQQEQQLQQLQQQHPLYAPSTSAQMHYQQLPRTQDMNAFGSPTYTHHPSYQPPFASNPPSQGSQESVDERSSPQLIFSHGYQQASPPYSSSQHDYSLGQQQDVQDHAPYMPKQHSLDAAESQYITQNRALLQAHTQGQTHLDSSRRFIQLHPQSQVDMKPPSQHSLQFWGQPQSQAQPQQQSHRNPWDAAGVTEGLYSGTLPKKKSSGEMSRHGNGSTDAPLSEHAPDAILRSFSSVSNASSDHSDSAANVIDTAASTRYDMYSGPPVNVHDVSYGSGYGNPAYQVEAAHPQAFHIPGQSSAYMAGPTGFDTTLSQSTSAAFNPTHVWQQGQILLPQYAEVRALAAAVLSSMLEGPAQKAYIIIAEAKSAARPPVRGFTTLSSTLGHLVIALHDGLLHAISNESQVPALINILKALGTLMMSAAYTRLPSNLLIRCIEHVQSTGTSTAGQGTLLTTLLDYSLTEGAGSMAACLCKIASQMFAEASSFASSTEKVQWNACYATGNLLKNYAAAALAAKRRQLQSLLSVLLALVRDSPNYKIRSHAAAALVSLGQRHLYEGLWEIALGVFCDAAADVESNGSPLDRDYTESGKNYQFKDMLQQQLKAGMQSLLTFATPADKSTAMYSTSNQVLQNLMLASSALQ
ncbi:hypothetical protein WJX79_004146 [Trebouxia sp. C0005]